MRGLRKFLLVLTCGVALQGAGCSLYLRDAVIGGAMDYVAGLTMEWLATLVPLSPPAVE